MPEYAIVGLAVCLLISLLLNAGMLSLAFIQWAGAKQERKDILASVRGLRERHDLAQHELMQIAAINNERVFAAIQRVSDKGSGSKSDIEAKYQSLLAIVAELRGEHHGRTSSIHDSWKDPAPTAPPAINIDIDQSRDKKEFKDRVDGDVNLNTGDGEQRNG